MMFDDNLRLCSNDSVAGLGFSVRSIGSFVNVGNEDLLYGDDPSVINPFGCYIRVTEAVTAFDTSAMTQVPVIAALPPATLQFAVVASTVETEAGATTTGIIVGTSELLVSSQISTVTSMRTLPAVGEEIFFYLNPVMLKSAIDAGTIVNPVTGEDYYTAELSRKFLSLITIQTSVTGVPEDPGAAGYNAATAPWGESGVTAKACEILTGKVDAWIVDRVPTIRKSVVDFSDYN